MDTHKKNLFGKNWVKSDEKIHFYSKIQKILFKIYLERNSKTFVPIPGTYFNKKSIKNGNRPFWTKRYTFCTFRLNQIRMIL